MMRERERENGFFDGGEKKGREKLAFFGFFLASFKINMRQKLTQSWSPASVSSHESKASAGSASAVSASEKADADDKEGEGADDVDVVVPLALALSTSMPVLPAIALATAWASTVSSATTVGGGDGGPEEPAVVSVVVVVEGFAQVFASRGACCPLLRCPATSLAAVVGACRRCAARIAPGRERQINASRERKRGKKLSGKRVELVKMLVSRLDTTRKPVSIFSPLLLLLFSSSSSSSSSSSDSLFYPPLF